jgi:hypothetical protein
MDPAIGVKDVLGDILGVDAVDGVADVLSRRHDETERQQNHHRDAVVQPEDGRVYVDVADFDEILQTPEYVQHGGRSLRFHAGEKKNVRKCRTELNEFNSATLEHESLPPSFPYSQFLHLHTQQQQQFLHLG